MPCDQTQVLHWESVKHCDYWTGCPLHRNIPWHFMVDSMEATLTKRIISTTAPACMETQSLADPFLQYWFTHHVPSNANGLAEEDFITCMSLLFGDTKISTMADCFTNALAQTKSEIYTVLSTEQLVAQSCIYRRCAFLFASWGNKIVVQSFSHHVDHKGIALQLRRESCHQVASSAGGPGSAELTQCLTAWSLYEWYRCECSCMLDANSHLSVIVGSLQFPAAGKLLFG